MTWVHNGEVIDKYGVFPRRQFSVQKGSFGVGDIHKERHIILQ